MIGLKIYTNKLIGASYEPWYELNSTSLINAMRDKKKDLLEIIRNVRR